MEKTTVFTHSLDLALRLVDTTSGRGVSGRGMTVRIDEKPVRFGEKGDGMLIFQNLGTRRFRLEISSSAYETAEREVDLDALGKGVPLLELHLIPGPGYPGAAEFQTLEGTLPGIENLSAVRVGDNACLIREFDPRKRLVKLFNPHHLSLDRVLYALVDPDNGCYEPFQIVRTLDDQTIKTDRVLETAFRNYFPISPTVMGTCGGDGRYCLRVRDDGTACKWLIRWEEQGTARFRTVDFRQEPHPRLEEGGG